MNSEVGTIFYTGLKFWWWHGAWLHGLFGPSVNVCISGGIKGNLKEFLCRAGVGWGVTVQHHVDRNVGRRLYRRRNEQSMKDVSRSW